MLEDLPDYVELSLEVGGVFDARTHADENLGDARADRLGVFANLGVVHGNVTPAQDFKSFSFDGPTNQIPAFFPHSPAALHQLL